MTTKGARASYKCIVADPPWEERGGGKIKRGADRHYNLLKTFEIIQTIIQCPLWSPAINSHLYLWTTSKFLPWAFDVMGACGFRYVTNFVWTKAKLIDGLWRPQAGGTGYYRRGAHEHLLLGVRGRPRRMDDSRSTRSTIFAPTTSHSAKPPEAYELIAKISDEPRAELFATGPRLGWDCWGKPGDDEKLWWATGCSGYTSPGQNRPVDD